MIPSTRWNVEINGKEYPPKEVMRYAHEQMNGEKLWYPGGGEGTNKYLKKLGFNISDKNADMENNLPDEEEKPFSEVIEELRVRMAHDESILNKFSFDPTKKDYVWIKDSTRTIGNLSAHYEISERNINPAFHVDIHFEDRKNKNIFSQQIQTLPENCEWFKWQNARSIRYKPGIDSKDEELVEKLRNQLLYLEQNLGDKIRRIINEQIMDTDESKKEKAQLKPNLNQILYGPPGTGKTYNTVNQALKIIDEEDENKLDFNNREEVKRQFDKRVEEGRIVFTTFHQSMSYEDFIEGIKPLKPNGDKPLQYDIKDGLFKSISINAFNHLIDKNREERNYYQSTFDELHSKFLESIQPFEGKDDYIFKTLYGHDLKLKEIKGSSIIVIFRWQDSKKTIAATQPFSVTKEKLKQLFEAGINPKNIKSLKESFTPYFQHNLSVYYAVYKKFYEFVESKTGLKSMEEVEVTDTLSYEELKEEWAMQPEDKRKIAIENSPNYIIIIDEINRGNVSQIFGELITLIEEDKRLGKDEALEATLPYSKQKFGVPPNLYIIGTMNTADRSVEALDAALRRRFCFEEIPSQPSLIVTDGKLKDQKGKINDIDLAQLLETINLRIEKLLDSDHQIGHSYFLKVGDQESLLNVFYENIIPLMQEYFFGDYGKIGLVLGSGFVKRKEWNKNSISFTDFPYESSKNFDEREIFEIMDYRKNEEYQIDEKDKINFKGAIQLLMKNNIE